jgi:hypothetical protein
MAKQDIIISIQLKGAEGASKSTDQLSNATKKLSDLQRQEAIEVAKVNEQIKIQRDINTAAAKSSLGLANATGLTAKQMKASRAQSGLNNAILLETGRLASDASFGFTAIANNLSQVVTLFSSFAKTAGGVGASLKQLAGSLIGTGGLLIALQLIISFGPQIFDFFARLLGATRELRDAMKGAADTIKQQTGSFEIYTRTLQNGWKSSEEMADATKMLKKEFPEYIKLLKDAGLSTEDLKNKNEEAIRITKEYTKQIKIQAMARQAAIKIEEEAAKIIQVQVDREVKAREEGFTSIKEVQQRLQVSQLELQRVEEEQSGKRFSQITDLERKEKRGIEGRIKNLKKILELNQDEIDDSEKTIDILMEFTDIQTKETKKGYGKRERNFKQHLLDLDKLEESFRQKAVDTQMMTADEIINQEEINAKAELKIRVDSFKAKQKLRLDEFLETTEDADERKKANDEYNESIRLADEESRQVTIELERAFNTKRTKLTRKRTEDDAKEQERIDDLERKQLDSRAANLDAIDEMGVKQAINTRIRNIESLKEDEARAKISVEKAVEGTDIKAQAELDLLDLKRKIALEEQALEQDKFDFINEQYGKISDSLTQTFGVTAHNQTVEIEERYNKEMEAAEGNAELQVKIREKMEKDKDKIARKQFKIDKAAKIGRALMDTYQSGVLAFGSQLIPGDPTSAVRAPIAQAIAIATGLANVANIARQKYQSSIGSGSSGTGGASGGGLQIQAPDFNVVGASQTSQLAQAVTTQQEKPVKAFVVGKDISTQQELDRNITNTASFG